ELQELQASRSRDLAKYQHDLRVGDPTTGWQVLTDKDGTQYRYNTVTGKATTLSGNQPYEPEGAQKLGGAGGDKPDILTDPTNNQQYLFNRRTNKATTLSGEPYEPGGAQRLGAGGAASAGAGREADIRAKMRVLNEDWLMLHPDATPAQISAQNFEHRKQAEKELAGAKAAPRADRNIEVRDETTNELLYRGEA